MITQLINTKGNPAVNQFVITGQDEKGMFELFQSYQSNIVKIYNREYPHLKTEVYLDEKYWDYSQTTRKHRNIFLKETSKETKEKIKSGEYILTNLN